MLSEPWPTPARQTQLHHPAMLNLCDFWRQSYEPAGVRLSRTAAPSLQGQLPLSLSYPPTVQGNHAPQGRLKHKPQRNHHTPRQGSRHTVGGTAKNQSERESSVCVEESDNWEMFLSGGVTAAAQTVAQSRAQLHSRGGRSPPFLG